MSLNATLRYGFDLDRDIFIDFIMMYHFCMPIITLLTLHPMVLYLLLFESSAMRSDIRRGYICTYSALILNEWIFCFLFRFYGGLPYAAIYCEGPLCRLGWNKQAIMASLFALLVIPTVLINPPFHFLNMRMHQLLVPADSKWKLSERTQYLLGIIDIAIMIVNVAGFGVFGRDHDRASELEKEPEIAWFLSRGGTVFLFGPPGDPQHFKWEMLLLGSGLGLLSPPLLFFTVQSVQIITSTKDNVATSTQAMTRRMSQVFLHQWLGALFHYIVPLIFMLIFTLNSWQFGLLFIAKNPRNRKALLARLNQLSCVALARVEQTLPVRIGPQSISNFTSGTQIH